MGCYSSVVTPLHASLIDTRMGRPDVGERGTVICFRLPENKGSRRPKELVCNFCGNFDCWVAQQTPSYEFRQRGKDTESCWVYLFLTCTTGVIEA